MVNLQNNQQASIILPALFDSETKQPLIKLELLRNEGKKNFDTVQVKEYYKNLILTSLFADVLIMGQGKTGSFALGSIKTTLIGNVIESMLKTIRDVVNRDLIRQTYQLNGWDAARACTVDYDNLEPIDLESLSKYVQRISSVGMMVKDVETINRIRSIMGVDPVEMTEEELVDKLTDVTSRSGDGMSTPFEGTRTSNGTGDDNSNNMDNQA
jgi:phage gp29-like protein